MTAVRMQALRLVIPHPSFGDANTLDHARLRRSRFSSADTYPRKRRGEEAQSIANSSR